MKHLLIYILLISTLSLSAQKIELHPVVEYGNNETSTYPRFGGDIVLSLESHFFDLDFEVGYRGALDQKLNHRFQLAATGQLSLTGDSKVVSIFGGPIYNVSQYDFEAVEGTQRRPYYIDDFGIIGGGMLSIGKLQFRLFAIGSFYELYGAVGLRYKICK